MAPTPAKGVLGSVTGLINRVLGLFGLKLTQKFVAHTVTVVLTGAAVALLPLEISTQLNGAIVVVAGLVAHFLAPKDP